MHISGETRCLSVPLSCSDEYFGLFKLEPSYVFFFMFSINIQTKATFQNFLVNLTAAPGFYWKKSWSHPTEPIRSQTARTEIWASQSDHVTSSHRHRNNTGSASLEHLNLKLSQFVWRWWTMKTRDMMVFIIYRWLEQSLPPEGGQVPPVEPVVPVLQATV